MLHPVHTGKKGDGSVHSFIFLGWWTWETFPGCCCGVFSLFCEIATWYRKGTIGSTALSSEAGAPRSLPHLMPWGSCTMQWQKVCPRRTCGWQSWASLDSFARGTASNRGTPRRGTKLHPACLYRRTRLCHWAIVLVGEAHRIATLCWRESMLAFWLAARLKGNHWSTSQNIPVSFCFFSLLYLAYYSL